MRTSSLIASSSRGDEGDVEATTGSVADGSNVSDELGEKDGRNENDDEMVEDKDESEFDMFARVGGSEDERPRSFSRFELRLFGEVAAASACCFLRSSISLILCHSRRSERITSGIITFIIHFCQPLIYECKLSAHALRFTNYCTIERENNHELLQISRVTH